MSYKPKTIRRSPAQLRAYMRSYNDLAKGLRALRKLIDLEAEYHKKAKINIRVAKENIEEAEELFK